MGSLDETAWAEWHKAVLEVCREAEQRLSELRRYHRRLRKDTDACILAVAALEEERSKELAIT